ncbi:atrial natriuretic peptide receptor 3-like [Ptychodera flava]|uniref:atrial natriuretic peptide receptor 3-like n=1 Tax=Ptychodera flava TaxID=63121 RepID=UPI00396A8873
MTPSTTDRHTALNSCRTFKDKNVTIGYEVSYDNNPGIRVVQNILKKTIREGRIVVLCAPKVDRRMIILEAHDMGMTNGDYVFYTVEMLPDEDVISAEETYLGDDGRNEDARKAFEAVFHMSLAALTASEVDDFTIEVAKRLEDPPWSMTLPPDTKGNKYAAFLHDAMILYILAVNDTVSDKKDYRNGAIMLEAIANKFFKGISGNVLIDEYGDREPDYWITDLQENGAFEKIAEVVNLDDGSRMATVSFTVNGLISSL